MHYLKVLLSKVKAIQTLDPSYSEIFPGNNGNVSLVLKLFAYYFINKEGSSKPNFDIQ